MNTNPQKDEISGCRVQSCRCVGELQRLVEQQHPDEDNAEDGAKNRDLAKASQGVIILHITQEVTP